ncbi:hypothetical protein FOA52_014585 [Chlamydomonas sp. UWO 241]|nr:hypothetical protein FOA52_014585 [Chlamydomonas sp. UWO 241]
MARLLGQRQGNDKSWMLQVRSQFKANMREVDDAKISEQREAAIRALHNVHLLEADRYVQANKKKGTPPRPGGPDFPFTPRGGSPKP